MSSEGETKNSDGLKLFTKKWLPSGAPKAVLFIIHGAGEYCERYEEAAQKFNSKGIAVFSHDHQGHGNSEGTQMHVENFADYTNDTLQYFRETLEANPTLATLPRFIWGHSMGGKIAAQILIRAEEEKLELSAAVLTGPALMVDPGTDNAINRFLARTLSKIAPKFAVPWEKGPVAKFTVCGDPGREKAYREDPKNYHGCLRVNWAWQFIKGIDYVVEHAEKCTMPVLGMHGTEDGICVPAGTERWIGRIASKDKKFSSYQGAFHELHNDVEETRNKALDEIQAWMDAHMTPPKPSSAYV